MNFKEGTPLKVFFVLFLGMFLSISCSSAAGSITPTTGSSDVLGFLESDGSITPVSFCSDSAWDDWSCGSKAVLGILTTNRVDIDFDFTNKENMGNFKEISAFLSQNTFPNYVIQNAVLDDLSPEESIIQLKNGSCWILGYGCSIDEHFVIYEGISEDKGNIVVSDGLNNYEEYSPIEFKEIFTGYAIIPQNSNIQMNKIITNPDKQKEIIGNTKKRQTKINKKSKPQTKPTSGKSNLQAIKATYSSQSPIIMNMAKEINQKRLNEEGKAIAALKEAQKIKYHYHYETLQTLESTWNSKSGNCCENARFLSALLKNLGFQAKYIHGKTCRSKTNSHKVYRGHVWTQVLIDGKWVYADGSNQNNKLGSHGLICKTESGKLDDFNF